MVEPLRPRRPIVITPTDTVVQEAVRELNLDNVDMVKIEPTCPGNAEAYVTNKDYLQGDPNNRRIIHLCYPKIMGQFKKALGKAGYTPSNPDHQKHLKEVIKAHLKNVTLPHEAEHIRQEVELGGRFPNDAELRAKRVEHPEALKELGIIERMAASVGRLDEISERLEGLGLNGHAEALDEITERMLKLSGEKGSSDFMHGSQADRALGDNDLADVTLVARNLSNAGSSKRIFNSLKTKLPDNAHLLIELAELYPSAPVVEKNIIRNMYTMLCIDKSKVPQAASYILKHKSSVSPQSVQQVVPLIDSQMSKLASVLDKMASDLESVGNVVGALEFDKISDSLDALRESMRKLDYTQLNIVPQYEPALPGVKDQFLIDKVANLVYKLEQTYKQYRTFDSIEALLHDIINLPPEAERVGHDEGEKGVITLAKLALSRGPNEDIIGNILVMKDVADRATGHKKKPLLRSWSQPGRGQ